MKKREEEAAPSIQDMTPSEPTLVVSNLGADSLFLHAHAQKHELEALSPALA
jgi:hypothetical protein